MGGNLLPEAFAFAHRRLHLALLDFLWKILWIAATAALLLLAAVWIGGSLSTVQWQNSSVGGAGSLLAAILIREFWKQHAEGIFWAGAGIFALSLMVRVILEVSCRARIVSTLERDLAACNPPARRIFSEGSRTAPFLTYLAASLAKKAVLLASAVILGLIAFGRYFATPLGDWTSLLPETLGTIIGCVVALGSLALLLTMLDTLFRSNAIDLFGTDLIRVAGVIGILLMVQMFVQTSIAIGVVIGFLNVASVAEAGLMACVAAACLLLCAFLHSYLLLVRFSAIVIMRHNVVEI